MIGKAFVHTAIDDHSRVAYAEIHGDETAVTAVGVLKRAVSCSPIAGSPSSGSCPTTAQPINPTSGEMPAWNWASR